MTRWRTLLLVILIPAACFGQQIPNFSGVFIRTGEFSGKGKREQKYQPPLSSPLVLEMKQTNDWLYVSAFQNGASSKSSYRLNGSETRNEDFNGGQTEDRIEFKHQIFRIKSTVLKISGTEVQGMSRTHPTQIWELSPDLRTLTIKRLFSFGEYHRETYARQPSLNAATERAESESEMNTCNAFAAFLAKPANRQSADGMKLGATGFQQFGKFVLFDAGIAGPFFHGLVRVDKPGGVEFRKDGQPVQNYTDSLVLEIEPRISGVPSGFGLSPGVPAQYLDLYFHLKWTGSETRDLGDVKSELLEESWPELRTPQKWYKLEVPAENVPLSDNLEIRILSSAGKQLGCITGHI